VTFSTPGPVSPPVSAFQQYIIDRDATLAAAVTSLGAIAIAGLMLIVFLLAVVAVVTAFRRRS